MSVFPRVFLHKNEESAIYHGFPWVYDNEIAFVKDGHRQLPFGECGLPGGCAVEVYTKGGAFVGTGIANTKSKIAVRFLDSCRAGELFDSPEALHTERAAAFFRRRIETAYAARFLYFSRHDSYRLVFAEADGIPGFIADRYCGTDGRVWIAVQFLSLACELFRGELLDALREVCRPAGIYERSDVQVRSLEGLETQSGWVHGKTAFPIEIKENGVLIAVDMENGQKTGYFLDQKQNRLVVQQLAKGRRVLDAFAHTGAFGLNAARGGAASVISADISESAAALIKKNIEANRMGQVMQAVCADVFELLRSYEASGERFDMIILDPPAFTKSSKNIERAYGGYKEINLRAMKLLCAGGILVSCSCSHFFDSARFYGMLMNASADARRRVQILEKRGASADHPVLSGYERSEYLKCAIMRVL